MQQRMRRSGLILGLVALGGLALTAGSAQADSGPGPYYAEPAWSQQLPIATRFVVLTDWTNDAVLDKETGLVWERSPANTSTQGWGTARTVCTARTTGARKGWRLPSVHELASLIHPNVPGQTLPSGHPFLNVQSANYWSSTSDVDNPTLAWGVLFVDGRVYLLNKFLYSVPIFAWCVRGGMNAAAY